MRPLTQVVDVSVSPQTFNQLNDQYFSGRLGGDTGREAGLCEFR